MKSLLSRCVLMSAVSGCLLATAPWATADTFAETPTVLFTGGTGGSLGKLVADDTYGTQDDFLGGAYRNATFTVVDYPSAMWPVTGPLDVRFGESVAIGAANIETAVRSASGPVTVAGVSQGAVAVQSAMLVLNEDPAVPSDTVYVIIADPNLGLFQPYGDPLPVLDYVPRPLPETRFNVIVVTNEYDGWADPIADPTNVLTVVNAIMAMTYVHPFAQNSDLTTVPPENISVSVNSQGGVTTTYLVPTKQLPLTMPLRQLGAPDPVVDSIDGALRPIIDAGYARADGELPLESGLQVLLSGTPQLEHPRGTHQGGDQTAEHRGQQNRHAQRQVPAPGQKGELGRLGVLGDEDQQNGQNQEAQDQRHPQRPGPGERHV